MLFRYCLGRHGGCKYLVFVDSGNESRKEYLGHCAGIFLGALLLLFLDCIVPHMHPGTNEEERKESHFKKTTKLVFAVTLHNILEGAILSLPLKSNDSSKHKAFWIGSLSCIVEPIFGYVTILFSNWILECLPFCLSFAAGAMLFVVVEELVPEMAQGKHSNLPTISFLFGFCTIMVLDVIFRISFHFFQKRVKII